MELSLSGNSLKTLHRCIICLARVGSELVLHASSSQVAFHTLNSSRSAYQSITFKTDFFDSCSILSSSSPEIRCSVLLKSVCSIFRTPVSSLSLLCLRLPSPDASKIQWTLHCQSGARKTYGISCNVEAEIQHLSLDRRRLPSSFVVRPRDLTRLLSNFQSSLQEITIIATDPSTAPSDSDGEIGGKAVELRSYIDPTKDNSDATLHTQLWIDPAEEFLQYRHVGDPVDVTFGVKELKKKCGLVFREGWRASWHMFFARLGADFVDPPLIVGKFNLKQNKSIMYFDATLVLATMLISQLNSETNASDQPHSVQVPEENDIQKNCSQSRHGKSAGPSAVAEHLSDHTKIWSDLSGPAARSSENSRERQEPVGRNPNLHTSDFVQGPEITHASSIPPAREAEVDILQKLEFEANRLKTKKRKDRQFTEEDHEKAWEELRSLEFFIIWEGNHPSNVSYVEEKNSPRNRHRLWRMLQAGLGRSWKSRGF
ncbi:hypothetical protein KSP39_PZI017345 [Platanthera zijinensis]|uniref:Uncharacterized protein n=1 Tax=Platanthera zijinensis TaxID=2320716 RepID=A0AAP0B4J4_9ASPA